MALIQLELSCAELERMRDDAEDFLLVDCREPEEFALVSIAGAVLLPMSELAVRVGELAGNEGRRVVVYCHLGGRSLRVAAWLRERGFAKAQSLAGGVDRWAEEIEPGMARY